MKTFYLKSILLFCALILLGCNKEEPNGNDTQGTSDEITTTANGQLKDITIGTEGAWYAVIDKDWCQLSQMEGEGKQTAQVNTVYNRTAEKRTATVSIYAGNTAQSVQGPARSSAAPVQTFTVTQEPNATTEAAPHFTAAKLEDGQVFFKLWTGHSGPIYDVDGSCLLYYSDGNVFIDNFFANTPNIETDWRAFGKVIFTDSNWGKIQIGGTPTLNTIKVEQSHTLKKLPDSPVQGSAAIHFVMNGKLYYGGGFSSALQERSSQGTVSYIENPCHDFYCFDFQTQTHKKLNNIAGSSGWAAVYNGTPYVVLTGDNSFLRYDISKDSWEFIDWVATGEQTVAFYETGGKMYIVGVQNRYECVFVDEKPKARNAVPHGITMDNVRTVKDSDGNVWLSAGNTIYKHSSSGYTRFAMLDNSYMLGAHSGEVYTHSTDIGTSLRKIDAVGKSHDLDLFFHINEPIANHRYSTPHKYSVDINGVLYIFGGAYESYSSNINRKPWGYSGNMFRLNAAGYAPASFMVVTD